MKLLIHHYHVEVLAFLSLGGTITSFCATALPIVQFLSATAGLLIALHAFIVQRKNKRKK